MKISELTNAPQWLKDAIVENEDVEVVNNYVIWKDGRWKSGMWKSGVWEGGTWKCGTWKSGVWKGGRWKDGRWEGGTWEGGVWEGGEWEDGVWEDGTWEGGMWKSGVWKSGVHSMMSKYIPFIYNNIITIGCKSKTIEEWNQWFSGKEEFDTKRGTKEFQMIYAHFKACEAYINAMK